MNPVNIGGYERITKHAARKRHNAGLACYALPCKLNPANIWQSPAAIPVYTPQGRTFAEWLNEYEYYNCTNETGRYTAFYKREGVQ